MDEWMKAALNKVSRMKEEDKVVRELATTSLYFFAQLVNPYHLYGEIHEEGFYYGRLPGSWLGESGQRQAQLVAEDLSGGHLAAVYHSPSLRTSQTAAAIAERHSGVARVCDDRLLEVKTPFDGCLGCLK